MIRFAPDDIKGGLYYFSPTIGASAGSDRCEQKPVDFITNGDETGCAGCHAVSREMARRSPSSLALVRRELDQRWSTESIRRCARFRSITQHWNFAWFNSTGDKFIANWSGSLKVQDSSTGAVLETVQPSQIGGLGLGAMPEWSYDNKWLAFVRYAEARRTTLAGRQCGDIVVMPYNGGSFGPATTVISAKIGSEVHFGQAGRPIASGWCSTRRRARKLPAVQCDARRGLRLVKAIDDAGQPIASGSRSSCSPERISRIAATTGRSLRRFARTIATRSSCTRPLSLWFSGGSQPQLAMFGLDLDKARAGDGQDPSFHRLAVIQRAEHWQSLGDLDDGCGVCQRR